jgi:hypothetical protein
MAKQTINIGTAANDGTGTNLRAGGQIVNANFTELYTALGDGTDITLTATPAQLNLLSELSTLSFDIRDDSSSLISIEPGGTLKLKSNDGITTTVSQGDTVTISLDSNVLTETSTNTLTNKSISLSTNTITGTLAEFNTALSDDNFVSLTGSETLTNKTVNLSSNTLSGTTAEFNTALSDGDFATLTGTETLTNKTVNLSSNTLNGTTAQFNTALSDGDFATLAGTETLTNKTVNLSNNTLLGTIAQFNTALSDGDFATLAGTETLTNKTINGSNNTLSNIANASLTNSSVSIGTSTISLGAAATTSIANLNLTGTSALSGTGTIDLTGSGSKARFNFANAGALPNNVTYAGMFATTTGSAKAFFADSGSWNELLSENSSIKDLSDVAGTSPTNGQVLVFNSTTGRYEPGTVSGGGGGVGTVTSITAGTGLSGGTITSSGTIAIDSTVATLTGTQTLTNKTINLTSNTLLGTTAQFNSALSDGDFATLAGAETLTNKTINLSSNTLSGKLYIDVYGTKYNADASNAYHGIVITVATKTTAHIAYGVGSALGYVLDGVESPFLNLKVGNTYRFDQSAASNSGHPLLFYYDVNKTTQYSTGVTTSGTPGSAGAYTQIVVSETTPNILFYQCSAHANMGSRADLDTSNFIDPTFTSTTGTTISSASSIVTLTGTQTLTNKTLTTPVISTISNTGTLTLPTSTDTLVGRATTDTLTNKTLTTPVISTISNTGTLTLPTSTDTLVGRATTDTLTNKTINLTSNSLTGTTAQFNTALSDGDFATLAGTETLTNKTINSTNNTITNINSNNFSDKVLQTSASIDVTNSGSSGYLFDSHYSGNNPTLYLRAGHTYALNLNVSGHPFHLQTVSGGYSSGNAYTTGITHISSTGVVTTGASALLQVTGTLYIEVPSGSSTSIYYACQYHSSMAGKIVLGNITDTATGNGATTAFTINSGRNVNDVLVFVNGICLVPTTDYTIASTTLTFVTAPAASAEIQIRYL